MQKKGFTIVEVVVVFLLILGVTFLILPRSLDSTKHARFISQWHEKYSEVEYMFSVIKAQGDCELKEKFQDAHNNNERTEILLQTIKPYLRTTSPVETGYKQKFMNGGVVSPGGRYYFDSFYLTDSNEIIGLKWYAQHCTANEVCGMISIDLNGAEPPNVWGYDVFAINIYNDKIEPLGKQIAPDILKKDCTKFGFGLYCSYYYLIGGEFD